MYVSSTGYADGATMPARFATRQVAGGAGVSVPLTWGDEPAGTRSYAVEMVDHHPVAHGWVHWSVVDVPAGARHIDEGASGSPAMPAGAVELPNTAGRVGYGGPQPPVGSGVHDYVVTVVALDAPSLGLPPNADLDEVREVERGHVLARATLTGRFGR